MTISSGLFRFLPILVLRFPKYNGGPIHRGGSVVAKKTDGRFFASWLRIVQISKLNHLVQQDAKEGAMISATATTYTASLYAAPKAGTAADTAKPEAEPQEQPQAEAAGEEASQKAMVNGYDLTEITTSDADQLGADLLESGAMTEIQLVALQIATFVSSYEKEEDKPFNLIEALEAQAATPDHPVFEGVPDLLQTLFELAGKTAPGDADPATGGE